jgi:DNA-directed RNA polymerase omega subunit
MDDANELLEQPEVPVVPAEPVPPIENRFLFVDVAALRAKQLRRGACARFQAEELALLAHKAERIAMEEVRRGLVYYYVRDQRQRQAVHLGGDLSSGTASSRAELRSEA